MLLSFLTDESDNSDTEAAINSEDGKNSNDDDDDNDDEDDGQDSDASGPISSYHEDLPGRCSVTRDGDVQGAESAPRKNDTYIVSELKHCIEDQEVRESDTEGSTSDHEMSMEKLQEESIGDLQYKHYNSKKSICDATFVINRTKVSSVSTHQGLSQFYKKPVSIVQPITSSGVKLADKTSPSKDGHLTNTESSGKLDLVQAVLYSRNKIAFALARIVEDKQLRVKPSQAVSDQSTCHTDGESEETSSGEESCSPCPSGKEYLYRFGERGIEKKASVIRSEVSDSETRQPMCFNELRHRPFVRRRSLKIAPSPPDHITNSSPYSVQSVENGSFDTLRVKPSTKRRSAPLGGSVKRNGQGTNVEGRFEDLAIMSPGSNGLGAPSGHQWQTTPLVPRPQQSSSSNSKNRRSSQILRVNKDTIAIGSRSSVDKKGACLEYHKESRGTFLEKGDTFPNTCCSTAKSASSTNYTPGAVAEVKSSKRSLVLKTEDVFAMSLEKRARGSYFAPNPSPSHQTPNTLLVRGEAVCKEKRDSCPTVPKHRRDKRLSCSNTISDLVTGNSGAQVYPSSLASWKNSNDNRGPVFNIQNGGFTLEDRNETVKGQFVNKLNCKRKLLEVSNPLRARASNEHLSADQAGLRSNPRTVKSLKKKVSSPSGSSRNSIVLSCALGSNSSPLGSKVSKKRSRECVAKDTPDSVPTKHAKTCSSLSRYLEQCPIQSRTSSQSLGLWGRESTPMKGRNVETLRIDRFCCQNTNTMSPIRRTAGHPCGSVHDAVVSPCKGLGSCDKSFCFDCC